MVEQDKNQISEQEAELYDRQIRYLPVDVHTVTLNFPYSFYHLECLLVLNYLYLLGSTGEQSYPN